jgi:DNA-binding NarL/FixJ family response regulator
MSTILIADDHPLTLLGTKSYVEHLGYRVVEACTNGLSAYSLIKVHRPSIAILDINMPGLTGLDILEKVFTEKLRTKIILVTMHKEYSIFKKATEYNLGGYLLKEKAASELELCIKTVLQGNTYLSKNIESELEVDEHSVTLNDYDKLTLTEKKIVELITQQYSSKRIADLLFVTEKTIEKHRSNIIEKLNLPKEKNALLMWALQQKSSGT